MLLEWMKPQREKTQKKRRQGEEHGQGEMMMGELEGQGQEVANWVIGPEVGMTAFHDPCLFAGSAAEY